MKSIRKSNGSEYDHRRIMIISIAFFLATAVVLIRYAAVLIQYFDSRHKENMALIEHNKQVGDIRRQSRRNPLNALKWGLLLVFSGIGLIIGELVEQNIGFDSEIIIPACMMIGGGSGLFLFYLMARNKYLMEKE